MSECNALTAVFLPSPLLAVPNDEVYFVTETEYSIQYIKSIYKMRKIKKIKKYMRTQKRTNVTAHLSTASVPTSYYSMCTIIPCAH